MKNTLSGLRPAMLLLVLIPVLASLLASCAKRPVATAAAPVPTVSAATAPASPRPTRAAPLPQMTAATPPVGSAGRGTQSPPAAARPPAPKEFTAIKEVRPIHFDFDKYEIRPGDAKILDENAKWMKDNADNLILIEGHADERGTNEYNLALGERRAKATMSYLVAQGVAASRMTLISYGEERPFCIEKSQACWAQNRRSSFLVKPR
ncbi:MAG: peptidoglycan-associated lipoprotein Pal [Candidatus Rokubacteria bacterium]|nr:peptidoglycan-associated lipoprotein Pal [Candidatus Rokubacteria bacterium]